MKQGVRALGVAESYRGRSGASYLAGTAVRASRVVDGIAYATATVGGTDATDAVISLYESADREDVRLVMVSGVALSWYNLVDLRVVHDATELPVLSVTYEESDGLREAVRQEFDGEALEERLSVYDSLPPRRRLDIDGNDLYVRSVGVDDERADEWLHGFTHDGRPEPLRVARLAARGLLAYEEGNSEENEGDA
jgi:endonuclease V-like protein UPF0215 family